MAYTAIALRIYTGSSVWGFNDAPVVALGQAPKEFHPKAPVLVTEKESWMITHAQDYTSYAAFSKAYKSQDGEEGHLLINIFVPAQQRIADGKSPLDVLKALMACFTANSLQNGALPPMPVDEVPFSTILSQFGLEERSFVLPIMAGKESASYCVDSLMQLDALMRFSRYPVLAGVGRLELGRNCRSTVQIFPKGNASSPKEVAKKEEVQVEQTKKKDVNTEKVRKEEKPAASKPKAEKQGPIKQGFVPDYHSLYPDEPAPKPKKKKSIFAKILIGIASVIGGLFALCVIFVICVIIFDPVEKLPEENVEKVDRVESVKEYTGEKKVEPDVEAIAELDSVLCDMPDSLAADSCW